MLKKTISYTDFDGNNVTEELNFHLFKSDVMEIATELPDGLFDSIDENNPTSEKNLSVIVDKLGRNGVFKFIKTLIIKSYGIKSADGRRFEKTEQLANEFSQSLAFDALLTELLANDAAAFEFMSKVIPADVAGNVLNKETVQQPVAVEAK